MAALGYERGELRVGETCMAPVKRNGRRSYEAAPVAWVSRDGAVVEVEIQRMGRLPFARSLLRRPGRS